MPVAAPTVLHVVQPTAPGGLARCITDYVGDQVGRSWEVVVACPDDGGPLVDQVVAAGARHEPWTAEREPGAGIPAEAWRLARILGRTRPDLVHLHSSKAGLVGRLVLRGRVPTLFQPHAWSFHATGRLLRPAVTRWERLAGRWADLVVCVSDGERDDGLRAGVRGRMVVVPNGVDVDRWPLAGPAHRVAARAELGLAAGPLAVCVGRLCPQKGQDVLVAAWPAVAAAVPGARLVLVGHGEDEERLRAAAPPGVAFAGWTDRVDRWYAAADVVVMPSRWEGMALTVLEAMATGRSVVGSDVAGVAEALGPGAGATVPPDDPDALAAALVERLAEPRRADAEGAAGRARVEEHYRLDRQTAVLADLVLTLTGRGPCAADGPQTSVWA